jgi:hypothetical protein
LKTLIPIESRTGSDAIGQFCGCRVWLNSGEARSAAREAPKVPKPCISLQAAIILRRSWSGLKSSISVFSCFLIVLLRAPANWQAALSNTLPLMQRKWVSRDFSDVTATTTCTPQFEGLSLALAGSKSISMPSNLVLRCHLVGGDDQVIPQSVGLKRFYQTCFSWRHISVTYTPPN